MAEPIYPQFFHSGQLNAPQMTGNEGAEGQILQVLDACLCTGFSPSTAVSVAIEGEFVVLDFGVSHGYMKHQFIIISGALDAALNGKHRIVSVTGVTIKIAKGAITSTGGTVKTLLAPLDWENMFGTEDSMQRAYRSKDVTSTRTVLYLDCNLKAVGKYHATNPFKRAKFNACRDMVELGVQIDSYTDLHNPNNFSSTQRLDGSLHWFQATGAISLSSKNVDGSRPWFILGDGKFFYFLAGFSAYHTTYPQHWNMRGIYFFGDLPKLSTADQFNCVFAVSEVDLPTTTIPPASGSANFYPYMGYATSTKAYFIKPITGIGGLERFNTSTSHFGGIFSSGRYGLRLNNPISFSLVFNDVVVRRSIENLFAGVLPWMKFIGTELYNVTEGVDLTWETDHLIVRTGHTTEYNNDNVYIGFKVLEARQEDRL